MHAERGSKDAAVDADRKKGGSVEEVLAGRSASQGRVGPPRSY